MKWRMYDINSWVRNDSSDLLFKYFLSKVKKSLDFCPVKVIYDDGILFVILFEMVWTTKTFTNIWLQWYEILVEADLNKSLPNIEIIWLPDTAIKESKERLRSTFRNAGIELPNRKFVLNLSPSDIKKVWTSFDLPMAVAIFVLINEWKLAHISDIPKFLFFGELWLDGNIKRVNGLLPSVISAIKKWYKDFVVPKENLYELEYISWINIYPFETFVDLVDFLSWKNEVKPINTVKSVADIELGNIDSNVDFENIKGQIIAKRAMGIAAAGLHNVLMVWAPWSGKTMLSKALQSILPPLSFDEILEVSQIYSVIWKLNKDQPLIVQRPFRQVHHTASKISIVWWWSNLTPWEVSLAHKWILFFDELTEFPRETLEVLRQPLEDKNVSISRVSGSVVYPANFMFVASMNPCKCGYYKDPEKHCTCGLNEIKKYQSKISGPLLDRIDMILEIPRENINNLLENIKGESSETIRQKVMKARDIQKDRFKNTNISSNSGMTSRDIDSYINLSWEAKDFLSNAANKLTLSPRLVHRIIKLGRTIADMEWDDELKVKYLAEAMQYRSRTMFVSS